MRLGVGNQFYGLEFDVAARYEGPSTGNPAGDLSAARSPRVIDDMGRDAVAAAVLGGELAFDGRLPGGDLAGFGVQSLLHPLAGDVLVGNTRRCHRDGLVGYRIAVHVGDDGLDVDPISGPHKGAVGANTHIEGRGMH